MPQPTQPQPLRPDRTRCICDTGPSTDGPEISCPQHGSVQMFAALYFEAFDFIERLRGVLLQGGQNASTVRQQAIDLYEEYAVADPESPSIHDLVISEGDEESWARCSCGVPLGDPLRADQSFDILAERWQRHVMLR